MDSETQESTADQSNPQQLEQKKADGKRNRKDSKKKEDEDEVEPIVGRVIGENEIGRFVDLGLGRGVDATKSSPWLSKSSFQVREVTFKNIIGTDEGGLVNNFEELVESVQQLQTNMSASVPASQQVSVGVDSELSRSYSKTKKSVGKKVLTRTISFKADFDDICVRRKKRKGGQDHAGHRTIPERALTLPEGEPAKTEIEAMLQPLEEDVPSSFEERLSKWILEHLPDKKMEALTKLEEDGVIAEDDNPVNKMIALTESEKRMRKDLRPLCHDFVATTCITHYVSAIELGASKYRVMSEEDIQTQLKTKGKIGVSSAADVSVSQQAKWYRRNKEQHETKIGTIQHGKVERGTTGEAVVGVKFQPISSVVVRCVVLKRALEAALQKYIENQGIAKYGPFYISCYSEQLFLRADDDNKVIVTDRLEKASEFFVIPCEEDGSSRHFSIFHNSESKLKQPETKPRRMRIKPIPRYLCVSVNFRGICDGPLELKLNAKESKSRLVLHDRRSKHFQPVELTDWVNGKEIFYINCKHRSFKKDSYICVAAKKGATAAAAAKGEGEVATITGRDKEAKGEEEISTAANDREKPTGAGTAGGGGEVDGGAIGEGKAHCYTTCCKPNISAHDDRTTFMLFRLIRAKRKDNWEEFDDDVDTEVQDGKRSPPEGRKGKGKRGPASTDTTGAHPLE